MMKTKKVIFLKKNISMFLPLHILSTYNIILFLLFSRILQLEEEFIQRVCSDIIALKPDVVFTEKGVSGKPFVDKRKEQSGQSLGLTTRL